MKMQRALIYRIFTTSRYENGVLKQGKRGQRRGETAFRFT